MFIYVLLVCSALLISGCQGEPAPFGACPTPDQVAWQRMEMPLHRYFLSTYYAVCQLRGYTEDLEINETLSKHQGAHLLGEISESTQMQNKE